MKLAKILVPTDFSAHSYEGLRTAEMLAHQADAELLIVHVLDPSDKHDDWPTDDAAKHHLEQRLFATMPASPDVRVSHALLDGKTADEIVRFAQQQHVDLIVMGSHGRAGLPQVLMGSVANRVIHDAPCGVLTVRPRVKLRGKTMAWAHRKPERHEPRSSPSI